MNDATTSLEASPTLSGLSAPGHTFGSLVEALEYAAQGATGYNFYNERGQLATVLSYRELRDRAQVLARKLSSLGCARGSRLAIVAETDPMFHLFFFACQYAGYVPVALPSSVQIGARAAYVSQLRRMLETCGAAMAIAPATHLGFLKEAASGMALAKVGAPEDFEALAEADLALNPMVGDELAYLQYTSGSTRFPRGVEITQTVAMANLLEIAREGLKIGPTDRIVAWLPFYHDMGLVGTVLMPLASQMSADYLSPRTFAMRPRLWLKVLSENRGTISSAPPFGYALCAKRLRWADCERYDLSAWRVACVGAERIHPEPLERFAALLQPAGFDPKAFVACYGMAECTLAISFAPLGAGMELDVVDKDAMTNAGVAQPIDPDQRDQNHSLTFVDCGRLMPSFQISIRDDQGRELPERRYGHVWVKGPSVMTGYFQDPEATREVLTADGWLNTGDIGYLMGDRLVITARHKDVIIIKGRNIWPQDLEHLGEQVHGVRYGHVSAFSAPGPDGTDMAILVAESHENNPTAQLRLIADIKSHVQTHFGIACHVDLVPSGTLPRTSSGKLSRSQTKRDFLARLMHEQTCNAAAMNG
ncbi:MAG: fatty acyl-AMP ligase [Xanthomonadaceae bacterium]|nr:fatty acyl-AMP ligase [Xanthomonadaceae bacterium]